jgi:hypothetical protein
MPEFFRDYPRVKFEKEMLKDITIRLDFIRKIKDNISLFQYVQVTEGQRPEDIAFALYDDPNLYWIILFLNDMIDPYFDWPLTDKQLMTFVKEKYGVSEAYTAHHYETTSSSDLGAGVWVDFGTSFSSAVSNWDYEHELNEEKRKIKVIKPRYIAQIIREYQQELRK